MVPSSRWVHSYHRHLPYFTNWRGIQEKYVSRKVRFTFCSILVLVTLYFITVGIEHKLDFEGAGPEGCVPISVLKVGSLTKSDYSRFKVSAMIFLFLVQWIFSFQFPIKVISTYPWKIRNTHNLDFAINDYRRYCCHIVVLHLYLNFITHIVYIINYLFATLTSSYLYNISNMFAKRTVGRENLYGVMLFLGLAFIQFIYQVLLVFLTYKTYIGLVLNSNMKCSDCNCIPEECKSSISPLECPDCILDECCCWKTINEN